MSTMEAARGRWREILPALGIPLNALNGREHPCPACEHARFRFTDHNGDGMFYCNGACGPGSGIHLLMAKYGWSRAEAFKRVDEVIGHKGEAPPADPEIERRKREYRALWRSGRAITLADPAGVHLNSRLFIPRFPSELRFVPALRHCDAPYAEHPAMIARVQTPDGRFDTIHRTWLTPDGRKIEGITPRAYLPGVHGSLTPGGAIRLMDYTDTLGAAEGIETAIAAAILFDMPVWSCMDAGGLAKFKPPAGLKRLVAFGDNDKSGEGQAAAWTLKKRFYKIIPQTEVRIPENVGDDWNNVLLAQFSALAA